ncbi:hypothetical protein ACEV6Q_22985 [Enterobacter ludwigii]|uniref:hypothetical protein n=1 Tax=Enterobacter ludwigii TaxID=299767 RepID=UPI003BEEF9B9
MSDFQWDPTSTQIYNSSFGNTALNGTGTQFGKKSGTEFRMDAPGCKLALAVTDETPVNWPLMDGNVDTFLDMYFEQGDFSLDARGNIYLGMKSDGGRYNTSESIKLDVTESTVSITSTDGQLIIGGKDSSFLQARYNGELILQALQIDFCAGNINCNGNSKITCSAINIEANLVNGDIQGTRPVFNLITDVTDTPQIEFKNKIKNGRNPWDFTGGSEKQTGTCNFVTNGKTSSNKGKFIFRGVQGFDKQYIQTAGFLAIDGIPVIGLDEFNARFNINEIYQDGQTYWTIEISMK